MQCRNQLASRGAALSVKMVERCRLIRMLRAFERWNAKRLLRPARQQSLALAHAWLEWRMACMFSVMACRSDPANEEEMQAVVERNARLNVSVWGSPTRARAMRARAHAHERVHRYVGGVCSQLRSLGNWHAEKEAELEQRLSETIWGDDLMSSSSKCSDMTTTSDRRIWMLEQKVSRRPFPCACV
jgi:hypothetical protein